MNSHEVRGVTIATDKKTWTDAKFMALSDEGHRCELINGELADVGNSGMEHGESAHSWDDLGDSFG